MAKEKDTKVTLKNGARVPVGEALFSYDMLQNIIECDPQHFKALRTLASGRVPDADKRILKDLKMAGFLMPDGSLKQSVRDVFASSYRPAEEGDVMVNPFAPTSLQEERLLQDRQDLYEHRVKNLSRRLGFDDLPSR